MNDTLQQLTDLISTGADLKNTEASLSEMRETLNAISISADHLKEVVDSVLTISKLEKQEKKTQMGLFFPCTIIENVAAIFKAKMQEKGLYLHVSVPKEWEQVAVIGDKHAITQVLINLISNSSKFTHTGGITIELTFEEISEKTRKYLQETKPLMPISHSASSSALSTSLDCPKDFPTLDDPSTNSSQILGKGHWHWNIGTRTTETF